ncbi:hypothetical protein Sme01_08980 [Sphaerisporangium melleum]|uniref:Uncharacterized protein n=1 Tax=Sphaerisporangium melleum TaxID=321316 RepID=A0A917VDS9_9ACTN|nr:hypothetical protein GCM10007964_08630 [Sphaerisporangium melleum]GII68422.1 hypothetical protein Sme01_08980 [Sphaerisporangium melleum]
MRGDASGIRAGHRAGPFPDRRRHSGIARRKDHGKSTTSGSYKDAGLKVAHRLNSLPSATEARETRWMTLKKSASLPATLIPSREVVMQQSKVTATVSTRGRAR